MKLRNKMTGEAIILIDHTFDNYNSLAEFNEEWEDVGDINVTNIPLIKDEKVRKAVRAWAEVNELSDKIRVINEHFDTCKFIGRCDSRNVCLDIEFKTTIAHADKDQFYTIAELCGEEEE